MTFISPVERQVIELGEVCRSPVSRNSTAQRPGILVKSYNNKQKFENQEDKFSKSATLAFQRRFNKKFRKMAKNRFR